MDLGILARGLARGYAMHHAEEQRKAALLQQQGYQQQSEIGKEKRQFGYDVQKTNLEHQNRLSEITAQQQGQQDVRKIIEEGLNSRNQGKGALTPEKYSQIFQRTHAEFLKQYDAPTALQLTQAALSGMAGMVGAGEPTAAPEWKPTVDAQPPPPVPTPAPPTPQPMGQSFPDVVNPTRFTSTDTRPPVTPAAPTGTVLDQKDAVIKHLVQLIQDPQSNPALRAKAEAELPQVRGRREELANVINPPTNAPPAGYSPKMQMDWQKNADTNAYRTGSLDLRREIALLGSNDKALQRDSMEKIARIISGDRAKSLQEKRAEFAQTLDLNRDKLDVDQQQFAEDLKYKYFSQEQQNFRNAYNQGQQNDRTAYTQDQANYRAGLKGQGGTEQQLKTLWQQYYFNLRKANDAKANGTDPTVYEEEMGRFARQINQLKQPAPPANPGAIPDPLPPATPLKDEIYKQAFPSPGPSTTPLYKRVPPLTTGPVNKAAPTSLGKPRAAPKRKRTRKDNDYSKGLY